jgi:hypothetical protein
MNARQKALENYEVPLINFKAILTETENMKKDIKMNLDQIVKVIET